MKPLLTLGLQMSVFERGTAGVPTTTPTIGLVPLQGRIDSLEFSITDQFGFETLTCSFTGTLEEGLDWLIFGLMRSCEVVSPDGDTCWEGVLETIAVQFGQEQRSVSVREMANRIRVRYQTVLGSQGARPTSTTFFEDAASEALYGKKDLVLAVGNTSDGTEVDDYANAKLAKLANPHAAPSSEIASGDLGEIRITLTFAGWYATTEWVVASNTSTTKTSTTTQIGTILTALAAVNNFISTSTANIVASGVTATEFIDQDTTYRAKIEQLMQRGNGTDPYAWGVYENRTFEADVYAGADPTAVTYYRNLGEAALRDSGLADVAFWDARPNANYQVIELLDIAPVTGQQDSAAGFYVARTTCTIGAGQISLRLEPGEGTDLEAVLITKYF